MSEGKPLMPLCPYHGDPKAMTYSSASNEYAACEKCCRGGELWFRPVKSWTNAFAWKKVTELETFCRQMAEAAELSLQFCREGMAAAKRRPESDFHSGKEFVAELVLDVLEPALESYRRAMGTKE